MPSEPKYHHLLPKTYMEPWCHQSNTVYTYNKDTKDYKDSNIAHICGIKYYHSIKAGFLHTNQKALNNIFGFLNKYKIYLNDEELDDYIKLNMNFAFYDDWKLYFQDGNSVSKKMKRTIKQEIISNKDNNIEKQWDKEFENRWKSIIYSLNDKIVKIRGGANLTLFQDEFATMMDYIVMFDWRGASGNKQLNDFFSWLDDKFDLSDIEIPVSKRTHKTHKDALSELKHQATLRSYDEFFNKRGAMYETLKIYQKELTFSFCIANQNKKFVTSDNPSFMFQNKNGYFEHVFIALPNLLISLCKKDKKSPGTYLIGYANDDEIDYYNQQIFEKGNMILLPKKNDLDCFNIKN